MKVVCDQCGTKYSIDDRRIAGKSFKVRCRQCAHVIRLHDARAALAETPPAGAWHVVTDGTSRQLALDELRRLLAQGALDDRSLVWREGFDDWRELGAVDELRAAPPCTVAPQAGPPAPGPDQPALVHQRNETSVLFTLGNLARLAAPLPPASPASGGEGSGLLDIQSLARSLAPERSERAGTDLPVFGELMFTEPAALIPRPVPARDRRLVWGLAASAGALAIASAVLVVIVVRGGAAPVHTEASHAGPARTEASHVEASHADAPHAEASHAEASHADASRTEASRAEAPHGAPSHAEASHGYASHAQASHAGASHAHASPLDASHPGPGRSDGSPADTVRADASHTAPSRGTGPGHPATVVGPGAPAERPAEACSEVTCVVGGYADPCCAIYRPHAGTAGPASPSPGAGLPDGLDRPAIAAGLARIDTHGCRDSSPAHGDVAVSVKVSPAGTVTGATVRSSPDPALAACVTAAVRAGSFAATQHGGSFAYVWRF